MTDIALNNIASGYNLSNINNNFEMIEDVINTEVLHNTGGNNVMGQSLDMNTHRILNLPEPTNPTDVVRLQDLEEAIAGVGGSIGGSGGGSGYASFAEQYIVASAGQSSFTLDYSYLPGSNSLAVYHNGSRLIVDEDFQETSPTTVSLTVPAQDGDEFVFLIGQEVSTAISADNVTYSVGAVGYVQRSVQTKLREFVSVKDFGAVGDGVTNDTAAFNATSSGFVFVPRGQYKLSGWAPKDNTTYLFSSDAVLVQSNDSEPIVSFRNGSKNIKFIGGTFVGRATSSAGACAIFDKQAANFRNDILLDNCVFDTFGGMALVLGGAKGWHIRNCIFRRTAQLNIPSGTTSYPAIWCSDDQTPLSFGRSSDLIIEGCVFEDMYWSGVYALGLRINIKNCIFRNTRESSIFISQYAERISVVGNTIDGTTMQNISASGVEVGGEFVDVIGNRITGCGAFGVSVQDAMFFNVASNLISFNNVGVGVITSSPTQPPRYGMVKANIITNSTQQGMLFSKVGSGALIQDCDFSGNFATTSGNREIEYSASSGLLSSNSFSNFNSAETSQPEVVEANIQGLTVGTDRVLLTSRFRPRAIEASFVNPGAQSRLCLSRAVFDVSGSIVQGSQNISEAGATIDQVNFITLPGIFSAEITGISYNTTSFLWEVLCEVKTNVGVAVWGNFTIYP